VEVEPGDNVDKEQAIVDPLEDHKHVCDASGAVAFAFERHLEDGTKDADCAQAHLQDENHVEHFVNLEGFHVLFNMLIRERVDKSFSGITLLIAIKLVEEHKEAQDERVVTNLHHDKHLEPLLLTHLNVLFHCVVVFVHLDELLACCVQDGIGDSVFILSKAVELCELGFELEKHVCDVWLDQPRVQHSRNVDGNEVHVSHLIDHVQQCSLHALPLLALEFSVGEVYAHHDCDLVMPRLHKDVVHALPVDDTVS